MNAIPVASAVLAVVSFKDADKIKSWDAWAIEYNIPLGKFKEGHYA